MTRMGMIFECGPYGADIQVCKLLAKKLRPDLKILTVTLDNKPNLLTECGEATAELFERGCERVIIVWDLYPAWRKHGESACRKEDREAILQSLLDAGVTSPHVYLVCIEKELEAWLLADGSAISKVLSRRSHLVKISDQKKTERIQNPKKRLNRLFKEHTGRAYIDRQHALKIAKEINLDKLERRCSTFARFVEKIM